VRRETSVSRLAKSSGLDPEAVVLELIERGIEIDDPDKTIDGATWKAARAIVKQMKAGGRITVRAKNPPEVSYALEPSPRSSALVGMLSVEDVAFIHERLCADFATTPDPIDPPGVRSAGLLDSAVNRQHSGFGGLLKYHDPVLNAATLLYGICNDHPFHNGNKRTALVAALAHLDRNKLVLKATKQKELFNLMIAVADHSVVQNAVKIGRDTQLVPRRGEPDEEVEAIAAWFRSRVAQITRGETPITYRELRQILTNFKFELHPMANRKMDVCAIETRRGLFRTREHRKTLMAISWPGDGRIVPMPQIKHIRQTLKLCEGDGVTSDAFYSKGVRIDSFINEYRQVLRKLASR
jgi:death-on-curing protein